VSGARTPPPARNLASDFFILRSRAKGLDLRRRPATVPENPNGHVDDEETAGLDGHRQPVARAAAGGRPVTAPHPEKR
jgi:hypothetical protein